MDVYLLRIIHDPMETIYTHIQLLNHQFNFVAVVVAFGCCKCLLDRQSILYVYTKEKQIKYVALIACESNSMHIIISGLFIGLFYNYVYTIHTLYTGLCINKIYICIAII